MQANQKISKDKGVRQRNLSGAFFDMPDFQEVCMGRKIDDLSMEEKIAHFDDVAARALPLWAYPENADKKLLNFTENATYLVKTAGVPHRGGLKQMFLKFGRFFCIITEV